MPNTKTPETVGNERPRKEINYGNMKPCPGMCATLHTATHNIELYVTTSVTTHPSKLYDTSIIINLILDGMTHSSGGVCACVRVNDVRDPT